MLTIRAGLLCFVGLAAFPGLAAPTRSSLPTAAELNAVFKRYHVEATIVDLDIRLLRGAQMNGRARKAYELVPKHRHELATGLGVPGDVENYSRKWEKDLDCFYKNADTRYIKILSSAIIRVN